MLGSTASPAVGIFWHVNGLLVIDCSTLDEAEPYGDCLGHATGHYERWQEWQGLGTAPDHGSGVMVLTNGHDPGCAPLTNAVLDHLLGLESLPWLGRFRSPRAERREHPSKDWPVPAQARRRDTSPSHALADYANEYAHPAYGKVRITCDGAALRWEGLSFDLPMIHRHRHVFATVPKPMAWFGKRTVQFATGVGGHIESLAVPLELAVAPIVVRRRLDGA
jgi:hypothetical protein